MISSRAQRELRPCCEIYSTSFSVSDSPLTLRHFFLKKTWEEYIRPSLKRQRIPRRLEQNRPEHDRHEKREGSDSRVEEGVQDAQRTRQSVEDHGAPCACVACCMDCRDEKIESQPPVREPGEIAEALADGVGVAVGAVPAPDEEDGDEDVEGD